MNIALAASTQMLCSAQNRVLSFLPKRSVSFFRKLAIYNLQLIHPRLPRSFSRATINIVSLTKKYTTTSTRLDKYISTLLRSLNKDQSMFAHFGDQNLTEYIKTFASRVLIESLIDLTSFIIVQPSRVLSCSVSEFFTLRTTRRNDFKPSRS
jgi:hypothetical protein